MASSRKSASPCPVCHRTEQVRTMQTAYEAGELPLAPPPMPVSHVFLVRYLIVGMALVGGAVFLSFVILATGSFSWLQMMLSLVCIVIALLLSFLGIRHISQSDEEARRRYPLWDQAMEHWTRLRFCARDHVVFDPQSNKVLPNLAVKELLDLDRIAEQGAR